MPRQVLPPPTGVTQLPDVPHWGWHEYGMRVGFWRMKALLDELKIVPSLSINARVCLDYPRVARAARDGGLGIHGAFVRPASDPPGARPGGNDPPLGARCCGNSPAGRPVGWMGPGLTETLDTPELLAAAGIRYIADWVIDDEPCTIRTRSGTLVTLPYTLELNDIADDGGAAPRGGGVRVTLHGHFECLYREGRHRPKVMAIALHPYISGVPHRIKYLDTVLRRLSRKKGVLMWNGAQILDWYLKNRKS